MEPTHVILKPLITEKATQDMSEHHRYTFQVARSATKDQIKRAIESLYEVRVVDVSTQNRKGRMRRNRFGYWKTRAVKRAVVRIHDDDRIELF